METIQQLRNEFIRLRDSEGVKCLQGMASTGAGKTKAWLQEQIAKAQDELAMAATAGAEYLASEDFKTDCETAKETTIEVVQTAITHTEQAFRDGTAWANETGIPKAKQFYERTMAVLSVLWVILQVAYGVGKPWVVTTYNRCKPRVAQGLAFLAWVIVEGIAIALEAGESLATQAEEAIDTIIFESLAL